MGSDIVWRILTPGYETLGKHLPVLKNTLFGWVTAGEVGMSGSSQISQVNYCNLVINSDVLTDNIIVKFWELEELSKTKILSESEKIWKIILQRLSKEMCQKGLLLKYRLSPI